MLAVSLSENHIAVDGPAASGKSTVGLALAHALNMAYLDSGRIYRLFGALALERGIAPGDASAYAALLGREGFEILGGQAFCVGGRFYDEHLESAATELQAAHAAASPDTRALATEVARAYIDQVGSCVVVGRDAGTQIVPMAIAKFYLNADPAERLRRRAAEGHERAEVLAVKDGVDEKRFASGVPRHAEDALVLDVTDLAPEGVLCVLLRVAQERGLDGERSRQPTTFVGVGDVARAWDRARRREGERDIG